MAVDRRKFLKIAGTSAAGFGALPAANLLLDGTDRARASADQTAETLKGADKVLGEGTHWAMVVDMRKLTEEDVHHAVEACHRYHNVPDIRTEDGEVDHKHEIKWIWPEHFHNAFPNSSTNQPYVSARTEKMEFLVLCNHCIDPPCCRVCPTKATFKRESDGIVIMDMHRCIGCRFCMAGCPYGSRSFNFMDPRPFIEKVNLDYPTRSKGVVEKCNFCAERISKGQFPACVEAVQSGALVFGDLDQPSSPVRKLLDENHHIRRKPSLGTGPNVYYII